MRVVILAAGDGGRLRAGCPAAARRPKILLEVGGRTLLERHFDNLRMMGVDESAVTVVAGYMSDLLAACVPDRADTVINSDWRDTETLMSALIGIERQSRNGLRDTVVIHGDLAWDTWLLRAALDRSEGDVVLPFDRDGVGEESMKVYLTEGSRVCSLSKSRLDIRCAGESMGMFLIRRGALSLLLDSGWQKIHIERNAALDDLLSELARSGKLDLRGVDITSSRWEEIDDFSDLERANRLFSLSRHSTSSAPGDLAWEHVWTGRLNGVDGTPRESGALHGIGSWLARRGDLGRLVAEEVLAVSPSGAGGTILEAGCGSGAIQELVEGGGNVCVGIDVSYSAARLSTRLGRSALVADARYLPFRDGSFQLSFSSGMLDQLDDLSLEASLSELVRVTSATGSVVAVTASAGCRLHESIRRRLIRRGRWRYGRKRAMATLEPALRRVSPGAVISERGRGLLLQLHFVAYLFDHLPLPRRLWHGLSLVINWLLWPLNRFPGSVLVSRLDPRRSSAPAGRSPAEERRESSHA